MRLEQNEVRTKSTTLPYEVMQLLMTVEAIVNPEIAEDSELITNLCTIYACPATNEIPRKDALILQLADRYL